MVPLPRWLESTGDPLEAEPHCHILSYLYEVFIFYLQLNFTAVEPLSCCLQVLLVY